MISLRCKDCLGTMDVDEDREVFSCPYCGSKKILPLSDKVKITKIKSQAQLESERMAYEAKREDTRVAIKVLAVIYGSFFVVIIILMILVNILGWE